MSKGSGRRPASVTEAEIAARWKKAFAKDNDKTLAQESAPGIPIRWEDIPASRIMPHGSEECACDLCFALRNDDYSAFAEE